MIYSMTGFGRAEKIFDSRRYSVELKSVNSRYCDINIRLPRLFNFSENMVRKFVSDRLGRGKIDIYVFFEDTENSSSEVVVNTALAREYSRAVAAVAAETGRADDLTAVRLSSFPDVLSVRQRGADEEVLEAELKETVDAAVEGMLSMRAAEGRVLADDLLSKIGILEELRANIASRAPRVSEEYRVRLSQRIDEILEGDKRAFYDENRLSAETAIFADKCSVDEELKRLSSHFLQARSILSSGGTVGKRMDFLVQEINREINTIGSKANDIEITNNVLLMKNETEKIREQIQNLV